MLANRLLERARTLRPNDVLLRRRAAAVRRRTPVIVVPPMFGTRLVDGDGRKLWGWMRSVFTDPRAGVFPEARTAGLLRDFQFVPGLVGRDVLGGALRFLEDVGGYRAGEDLFALEYDWRHGVSYAAERLTELVERIRGAGEERVDLVCVSSGGLVARAYLTKAGPEAVRRVVYLGTPQRGTLQALQVLRDGFQLAPLGRRFAAEVPAHCQITWDLLPHPDERVFIDEHGRTIELDLYDPRVWRDYRITRTVLPDLPEHLDRARALHRSLEHTPVHDAFVIGARHITTRTRIVVTRGEATLPTCCPTGDHSRVPDYMGMGDGSVSETSLRGLPGLDPARVWLTTPPEHRWLVSDPPTQRLMLEALLATERRIPSAITPSERLVPLARAQSARLAPEPTVER